MPEPGALERLAEDGLVKRKGDRWRTTARWHAAMARAALRLQRDGAEWRDVRVPIALALLERHAELGDEALAALVEAMLPFEAGPPAAAAP